MKVPIKVRHEIYGKCIVIEFRDFGWVVIQAKDKKQHQVRANELTLLQGHMRAKVLSEMKSFKG